MKQKLDGVGVWGMWRYTILRLIGSLKPYDSELEGTCSTERSSTPFRTLKHDKADHFRLCDVQ